jgi:hypothetical protein
MRDYKDVERDLKIAKEEVILLEKEYKDIIMGDHIAYKVGNLFEIEDTGDIYILAEVGTGEMCLINMDTGIGWNNKVHVDNPYEISKKELEKMTRGGRFYYRRRT